jgi:hypothetical protein
MAAGAYASCIVGDERGMSRETGPVEPFGGRPYWSTCRTARGADTREPRRLMGPRTTARDPRVAAGAGAGRGVSS